MESNLHALTMSVLVLVQRKPNLVTQIVHTKCLGARQVHTALRLNDSSCLPLCVFGVK